MEAQPQAVTRVKIFNQTYDICGSDAEHVRRLADLVDSKMREAATITPTVDTAKLAILAALNIADDYYAAQGNLDGLEEKVAELGVRIRRGLGLLSGGDSPIPDK